MSSHISLLYPSQDDFFTLDERAEPQVFNYICLHGKQVFLSASNKHYNVLTAGWIPKDYQNLTNLERIKKVHCLFSTKEYEIAYMRFFKIVKELVYKSSSLNEQLELF